MARIKVFYDEQGNTLTGWFDKPESEYVCEETGDDVILMKNKEGKVVGFEKLNYVFSGPGPFSVAFEAATA